MTKLILIDSSFGLIRTAISDGGKLLDYYEESPDQGRTKGNIYKGLVKKVEGHIQAAFVRYGSGRDGFLPMRDGMTRADGDHEPAPEAARDRTDGNADATCGEEGSGGAGQDGAGPEGGEVRAAKPGRAQALRAGRGRKGRKVGRADAAVRKAPGPGDAVLVQVVKDEVGGKGAALTTRLSLSGRYLVYMPDKGGEGGISSRLGEDERAALKKAMAELRVPEGASIILRTAALGKPAAELQADLDRLVENHREILTAARTLKEPGLIYREAPPAQRYLREYYTSDIDRIWVNSEEMLEECRQFFRLYEPKAVAKVVLSKDGLIMFQKLGLEAEVEKLSARKVTLPSGANFVIDQTEALVAIDVNSAKSRADGVGKADGAGRGGDGEEDRGEPRRGRHDLEESVFAINMEAAGEIARQLRLRDLGGIIIVDFIDMEEDGHRRKVEAAMRRALSGDKAKVKVFDITPLGLLQISRQRLRKAGPHFSRSSCEACQGRGWHASPSSAASAVLRRMEEKARGRKGSAALTVSVAYPVANRLLNEFRPYVLDMEARHGCPIRILADPAPAGEPVFSSAQEIPAAAVAAVKTPRGRERTAAPRRAAPAPVEAAVSIPDSGLAHPQPPMPGAIPAAPVPVAAGPSPSYRRRSAIAPQAAAIEVETLESDLPAYAFKGAPGIAPGHMPMHPPGQGPMPDADGNPVGGGPVPEGTEDGSHERGSARGRRGRGRRGGRHRGHGPERPASALPVKPPIVRVSPPRRGEGASRPEGSAEKPPATRNPPRGGAPARTGGEMRGGGEARDAGAARGEGEMRGGDETRGGGEPRGEGVARAGGEARGRRRSRHRSRRGGGGGGGKQPS